MGYRSSTKLAWSIIIDSDDFDALNDEQRDAFEEYLENIDDNQTSDGLTVELVNLHDQSEYINFSINDYGLSETLEMMKNDNMIMVLRFPEFFDGGASYSLGQGDDQYVSEVHADDLQEGLNSEEVCRKVKVGIQERFGFETLDLYILDFSSVCYT